MRQSRCPARIRRFVPSVLCFPELLCCHRPQYHDAVSGAGQHAHGRVSCAAAHAYELLLYAKADHFVACFSTQFPANIICACWAGQRADRRPSFNTRRRGACVACLRPANLRPADLRSDLPPETTHDEALPGHQTSFPDTFEQPRQHHVWTRAFSSKVSTGDSSAPASAQVPRAQPARRLRAEAALCKPTVQSGNSHRRTQLRLPA